MIVITPLARSLQTVRPFIEKIFPENINDIQKKYQEIQKIYQNLRDQKKIQTYLQDASTQKLFEINERLYVDFRITDLIVPDLQDKPWIANLTTSKPTNEKLMPEGESMDEVIARCKAYTIDVNEKFKTKTIITITHKESVVLIQKAFKDFDYLTKKHDFNTTNGNIIIRYRDNDRKMEMDLHKPYVDSYRFKKGNKEYRRVPEVMDCWFESGSMPFGQAGYTGNKSTKPFVYPADFIIEGLDQTRGRFRGMHVCGNAVMKQNSFNHVVINGLVLAEDGKKMSKKLKNYPDPEYLF